MHNKWINNTWIIKFKSSIFMKKIEVICCKDNRGCVETAEMCYVLWWTSPSIVAEKDQFFNSYDLAQITLLFCIREQKKKIWTKITGYLWQLNSKKILNHLNWKLFLTGLFYWGIVLHMEPAFLINSSYICRAW